MSELSITQNQRKAIRKILQITRGLVTPKLGFGAQLGEEVVADPEFDINPDDLEFITRLSKASTKTIDGSEFEDLIKILIDMKVNRRIFSEAATNALLEFEEPIDDIYGFVDDIEISALLADQFGESIAWADAKFEDAVGEGIEPTLRNLIRFAERTPTESTTTSFTESSSIPQSQKPKEEDVAAGQSGVGTQATINEESALVEAAQIAQQNELLKSMILEQNLNMDILADDITFEEHLAITKRRFDESARLQLDEFEIGDSALEMQQAHRTLDQQLNLNLHYGIPLI